MADTPEPKAKVTSADIRAALVLRYPAQSHALMFEVAPQTGGGTRYADAVSVGLWASHGHAIEGFEIKVSRADWLNELKQPEKSEPVAKYCHRWWLACAPGIAMADELPPGWGMLELQAGGTLRVKVQATKREPVAITPGFFASLIRRGAEPDNEAIAKLVQREMRAFAERFQEDKRQSDRQRLSYEHERALEAMKQIEELKARTGVDLLDHRHGADWFKSVDILDKLGNPWGGLAGVRDGMERCLKLIEDSGVLPDKSE